MNTSVSGALTFAGDPSNYFDPNYFFVPASGYLNAAGPTVTISATAVEFGFDDGASQIAADFSATTLSVNDLIEATGATNGFVMTFSDSGFAGQSLAPMADSFPFASYSLIGDVITLSYAGGNPTAGQTLSASFAVTPAPEPSTWRDCSIALFASLALLGGRRLLRRRVTFETRAHQVG